MRLRTIKELTDNNIPVNAMLAPIIPGINSHEILNLAEAVSLAGAFSFSHTVVHLNGAIGELFTDWIRKTMPDKADKVLNQIAQCHGGRLNDSRFGRRMKGEGPIALQISELAKLAKARYFKNKSAPKLNTTLYRNVGDIQFKLFK